MLSLIHPHNQEMFEDIKGVIRRRKTQNDRQYNVQIKRYRILLVCGPSWVSTFDRIEPN